MRARDRLPGTLQCTRNRAARFLYSRHRFWVQKWQRYRNVLQPLDIGSIALCFSSDEFFYFDFSAPLPAVLCGS